MKKSAAVVLLVLFSLGCKAPPEITTVKDIGHVALSNYVENNCDILKRVLFSLELRQARERELSMALDLKLVEGEDPKKFTAEYIVKMVKGRIAKNDTLRDKHAEEIRSFYRSMARNNEELARYLKLDQMVNEWMTTGMDPVAMADQLLSIIQQSGLLGEAGTKKVKTVSLDDLSLPDINPVLEDKPLSERMKEKTNNE